MAVLTRDDVLKLAQLARLSLTDAEIEEFSRELSAILEYVKQLQKADTASLEPTSQVSGLETVTRDDIIKDYGINREDLLKNVPEVEDGQVKVRRMIG